MEQKCLSLSCEEVGRILFERKTPVSLVDHEMPDFYDQGEEAEVFDEDEDRDYIAFMEQVQERAVHILQDRSRSLEERMCQFLSFCSSVQDITNHYQAKGNLKVLKLPSEHTGGMQWSRSFSYQDFCDRFAVFTGMEELDDEWVNTKKEFAELFHEDTYEPLVVEYLSSGDYREEDYEQLLVYFTFRYLMNAVYDYDLISYARLVIVATLVVRDMDVVRFRRNGGHFSTLDRIDTARIFSKEVEHSQGNADDLKEMCMMEEIASLEALSRQI